MILGDQRDWSFATPQGPLTVRSEAGSSREIREALVDGFGIAIKSTWDVGRCSRAARSSRCSTTIRSRKTSRSAYPSRAHVPLKTLAFITFLAEHFGDPPYWDRADGP